MELQLASHAHIHWHMCNTFKTHTNINKFYKILKVAEDYTLKKKSPKVSHVAMRLQEEQRMLSHTSYFTLKECQPMTWFPFLGGLLNCWQLAYQSYSLRTLVPYSPKDSHGLSLFLPFGWGIQGKKRRNMIISLADPACLKCRCDSVRSWPLLLALRSLLLATPDAYAVGHSLKSIHGENSVSLPTSSTQEEWVSLASISSSIVVCKMVSRRGREGRRQKQLSRCCRRRKHLQNNLISNL